MQELEKLNNEACEALGIEPDVALYTPNNRDKLEEVILKDTLIDSVQWVFIPSGQVYMVVAEFITETAMGKPLRASGFAKTRPEALLNLVIKIAEQIKEQVKSEMFEY